MEGERELRVLLVDINKYGDHAVPKPQRRQRQLKQKRKNNVLEGEKLESVKEEEFILPDCGEDEKINRRHWLQSIKESPIKAKIPIEKKQRTYKCTQCSRSYVQSCHLRRHMKSHEDGWKKFRCKMCKKTYARSDDLVTHLRMHRNGGVKPFRCVICSKGFTRKENLNTHLQFHAGKRFECGKCLHLFSSKMNRDVHMKTHDPNHRRQRPLQCALCDKTSKTRRGMMFHMVVHTKGGAKAKDKRMTRAKTRASKTKRKVKTKIETEIETEIETKVKIKIKEEE